MKTISRTINIILAIMIIWFITSYTEIIIKNGYSSIEHRPEYSSYNLITTICKM